MLKGAAEPKPDSGENDEDNDEPEKEVVLIPGVTKVRQLSFDFLGLICVFEAPGPSASTIRLYRRCECCRVSTTRPL